MKLSNSKKLSHQVLTILFIDAIGVLIYLFLFILNPDMYFVAQKCKGGIQFWLYLNDFLFMFLAIASYQFFGLIVETKIMKNLFENSEKPNIFILFFTCFNNFIFYAARATFHHSFILLSVIIMIVLIKGAYALYLSKGRWLNDTNKKLDKNV